MTWALARRGLLFVGLWWVLVEGRTDAWWPGVLGVALAVGTSVIVLPPRPGGLSVRALPGFLGYFLLQSARGGLQVAAMALRAPLDLRPAVMALPLDLPAGAPRLFMTAVLSLMPGTVSVRLDDDRLTIHVLDERLPVAEGVQTLQQRVARLFGAPG